MSRLAQFSGEEWRPEAVSPWAWAAGNRSPEPRVAPVPLWWLGGAALLGLAVAEGLPALGPGVLARLLPGLVVATGLAVLVAMLRYSRAENFRWGRWWVGFPLGVALVFLGHGWAQLPDPLPSVVPPPREVTATLRIERLFAPSGQRYGGLATVLADHTTGGSLVGHRAFFSVWWPHHPEPLLPGMEIRLQGAAVWLTPERARPAADGSAASGFRAYLRQIDVRLEITRAELKAVEREASTTEAVGAALRSRFDEGLRAGVASEADARLAELWRAMLTGRKEGLTLEQRATFTNAGVMHLFAVSGLHIGLFALLLTRLGDALKLSPWTRLGLVAVVGGGFVWLIGSPPSAVRALVMVLTWEVARVTSRKPCARSALAAAAVLILIVDPRQLWTAGFQLSFMVMVGLLCYGLPLAAAWATWVYRRPWLRAQPPGGWAERLVPVVVAPAAPLTISLAATTFGAPLAAFYFGSVSLVGLALNVVMIPAASVAVPLGMVSGFAGMLGWVGLAADVNAIAYRWLGLMETLVLATGGQPGAAWVATWGSVAATAALCLGLLAAVTALPALTRPCRLLFWAAIPPVVAIWLAVTAAWVG